ncbi:FMN-binding protein [Alkaliphilus transvaalensis]|uniref:FMN-binding protein n=1 Tax=Alkaliphilus transvaalensis TaxID=114628 RepID=UPI00047C0798|nr:FMN-binding protein [Alkaliphilus transvaalensis]
MKKPKVKLFVISVISIMIILMALNYGLPYFQANRATAEALQINLVDLGLDEVIDGSYEGEYAIRMVTAKVKVIVDNHKIVDIELLAHDHSKGHEGSDIINRVISNQSLDVDVVTGSTISSKAILKSIEVALVNK